MGDVTVYALKNVQMAAELSQSAPSPYVCTSATQEKHQEAQQSQATQQQPASTQLWAAYSPQAGQIYLQPISTVSGTAPVQYVAVRLYS